MRRASSLSAQLLNAARSQTCCVPSLPASAVSRRSLSQLARSRPLASTSTTSTRTLQLARQRIRAFHMRVEPPYAVESGLPPFLSPNALKILAVDWQEGVLIRLNELVRGTEEENKTIVDTLRSSATDRTKILTFNLASEALNNSFFLYGLTDRPSTEPSPDLNHCIARHFGTVSGLKSVMSAHALGMAGSGYVWLVADYDRNLSVVGTYGSGTPLVQHRRHMANPADLYTIGSEENEEAIRKSLASEQSSEQPFVRSNYSSALSQAAGVGRPSLAFDGPYGVDSPTAHQQSPLAGAWSLHSTPGRPSPAASPLPGSGSPSSPSSRPSASDIPPNAPPSRSFSLRSSSSRALSTSPSDGKIYYEKKLTPTRQPGLELHPLLCISVHERAWMPDYGVWGKEEYLRNFWQAVDWSRVSERWQWLNDIKGETPTRLGEAARDQYNSVRPPIAGRSPPPPEGSSPLHY